MRSFGDICAVVLCQISTPAYLLGGMAALHVAPSYAFTAAERNFHDPPVDILVPRRLCELSAFVLAGPTRLVVNVQQLALQLRHWPRRPV